MGYKTVQIEVDTDYILDEISTDELIEELKTRRDFTEKKKYGLIAPSADFSNTPKRSAMLMFFKMPPLSPIEDVLREVQDRFYK